MQTRVSRLFLPCVLLLVAFVAGCDTTDESGVATFTGRVVESDGTPVGNANVVAPDYGITEVTNGQGEFVLDIEVDSSRQAIALEIFADGYEETNRDVLAFVDQVTRVPEIVLVRRGSNGGGDGEGDDGDGGIDDGADEPSGPAASITLVGRSSEAIGVQSAGTDETATLTFVVLDAFGNPVDSDHAVDVNFSIANGPGGGEFLAPAVKTTNGSGRVQTTISSGTRAGTVQAIATATNAEGTVIRSFPIVITITGGLPDDLHFSVVPESFNFPGYTRFGLINPITAFVGDIYANPVQPGTAVYFTTNAGIIAGSGTTDALGRTTVELVSASPLTTGQPPAACPTSNPIGYAQVTASTSDLNQETITSQTPVLFSGDSSIELVEANAGADGLGSYRFVVDDPFDHPLGPGTRIAVAADGVNVESVGDIAVELGDYLCPGPGRTEFNFSVVQGDEVGQDDLPLPPQLETITINVQSVNGNIQLTLFNEGGARRIQIERM